MNISPEVGMDDTHSHCFIRIADRSFAGIQPVAVGFGREAGAALAYN
jgi:hypothetical protein